MRPKIATILLLISFLFQSCRSMYPVERALKSSYIGMTQSEFNDKVKYAQLVKAESGKTVYRVSEHGNVNARFFYFRDSKLFQIDEGKRRADIEIDVNRNN